MSTVVSADGTAIARTRIGQGAPVVLVDGALCHRQAGPLTGVAEELSTRFTVTTYDRRGRGDSDGAGVVAEDALERELEDLAAVIADAGGPVSLFGMSSGGALALRAVAAGLPVTTVVAYEPPFYTADDQKEQARRYHGELIQLIAADRPGDAVALFLDRVGSPPEMIGQMRESPMWPGLTAVAPTLAHDSAIMADADLGAAVPAEPLSTVDVPALVLYGGNSPDWMLDGAQEAAKVLPRGEQRTLDGQDHDVSAAALAPVLADFFSRNA